MKMKRKQSLLDMLAENAGCPFISDLRHITGKERLRLADKPEEISPGDYPLPVWKDALNYLVSAPPKHTPEAAHKLLIDHYCNQEEIPFPQSSQGGNQYESN